LKSSFWSEGMGKSKVLVVGGTGYIGRRIVRACLAEGHETYVVQRPELGLQIEKLQMLLSFKKQGAHLLQASFSDHKSLVDAVKKVDVVISAISGVHFRTHCITLQLKLVDAIKEAGNVKVNNPSFSFLLLPLFFFFFFLKFPLFFFFFVSKPSIYQFYHFIFMIYHLQMF